MPEFSKSHFVLIPSYNTGEILLRTIRDAMKHWMPVWVVVDGSTDGTVERLQEFQKDVPELRVIVNERNLGKGAAVLHGLKEALVDGFTHALVMDADGQHPADDIQKIMRESIAHPDTMVLGLPIFDETAPKERLAGRKVANFFVDLVTWNGGIGDSLFGFKLYPAKEVVEIMESGLFARRYDFDAEVAVKLVWRGVRPINVPCPCRYLTGEEGGVSHFNYLRDNVLLTFMFARLLIGMILRSPLLLWKLATGRLGAIPYKPVE